MELVIPRAPAAAPRPASRTNSHSLALALFSSAILVVASVAALHSLRFPEPAHRPPHGMHWIHGDQNLSGAQVTPPHRCGPRSDHERPLSRPEPATTILLASDLLAPIWIPFDRERFEQAAFPFAWDYWCGGGDMWNGHP